MRWRWQDWRTVSEFFTTGLQTGQEGRKTHTKTLMLDSKKHQETNDMSNEFQIVFHNIDQSDALTECVQKRIDKLRRFSSEIIGGRVVLDSPHNNLHKGKVYSVAIEIQTRGKPVVVTQEQHDNHAHEDLYVAIRDAFNAAERQLKSVDKKHRIEAVHRNPEAVDDGVDEIDDTDLPEYSSAVG